MNSNYFFSLVCKNDVLYWMTRDAGELCSMDIVTGKCEKIETDSDIVGKKIYSAVLQADGKNIYGIGESGKYFWRYDDINKRCEEFEIGCNSCAIDLFAYAKLIEEIIVIINRLNKTIVWIDKESGSVVRVQECGESAYNVLLDESCEEMIVFDSLTGEISSVRKNGIYNKKIDEDLKHIISVVKHAGRKFYLKNDGWLYVYDEAGLINRINLGEGYVNIVKSKEYIWAIPWGKQAILKLNFDVEINDVISYPDGVEWAERIMDKELQRNNVKILELVDKIFFSTFGCNQILCIDKNSDKLDFKYKLDLGNRNHEDNCAVYKEVTSRALNEFLGYISSGE